MPTVDDFLGGVVKKPRKPGDFLRMANDTPQVAHPTKRTKKGAPNLVPYGRPSGLGDCLEDGYALTKWTERQMVKGWASIGADVADDFQHLLAAPDLDSAKRIAVSIETKLDLATRSRIFSAPDDDLPRLADTLIARWKRAADIKHSADVGTFIHRIIEGATLDMAEADRLGIRPEHIDVVRKEWAAFLDRYGFEVLAQELAVVNDVYGVAGTCDLVLRNGPLRLDLDGAAEIGAYDVIGADIKTGKLAVNNDDTPTYWATYPVQLAAYFRGSYVYDADAHAADVEAGTYTWEHPDSAGPYRTQWPWELRPDVALIVHIDAAKLLAGKRRDLISLVPVDLEVGRKGAALATAVREWRKLQGCGPAIGPAANKDAQPDDDVPLSVVDTVEPTTATTSTANSNVEAPVVAVVQAERTPQEQKAAVTTSPDEGADLNDSLHRSQWEALQYRYQDLDPAARAWINALREQAVHAGVDFHSGGGKRHARRFEILRGLIHLAECDGFDNDEQARNFAYSVTLDEALHWPAITAGHAVGSLNAEQAATFAQLCEYAAIGGVAAVVVDAKRIRYTLAA